ncbi:MAG: DUF5677 domain-containing protein [Candidatus Zixiibacteriota bacterium]
MRTVLQISPRFQIIDNKTTAYEAFKKLFESLERFFWIFDFLLTQSDKMFKVKEPSPHQFIALGYLAWVCGQIRGILILFNESLISQAQQLIRALWEAKVNLLYLAQNPEARVPIFNKKIAEELEKLRREADRGNPVLPSSLKGLPPLSDITKSKQELWDDKIVERAKQVNLEDEYLTIYRIYSWPGHAGAPAIRGYVSVNDKNISYDPNESVDEIPGNLVISIMFAFQILTELNNVLNILNPIEIEETTMEPLLTIHEYAKEKSEFINEKLPDLFKKFLQQQTQSPII